jgi:histidinol-phosphatase (PHP family)
MPLDTDLHSHVSRSSARHMVRAARKRGLRVLGLSEHDFQMEEVRPLLSNLPQEGPFMPFAAYLAAVRAAAEDERFDVRLSMEVDYVLAKHAEILAALQPHAWDYLIGSVHEVDGVMFENDQLRWEREAGQAVWLRYCALLREAVQSGAFEVVSHPVRMYRRNPHIPPTLDDELEQLAAEAAAHNVALEINGFDLIGYPEMVKRLARACALHRVPISVGSDAHLPAHVAQAHAQTEALLREFGLTTVRIWKQRQIEEYTI